MQWFKHQSNMRHNIKIKRVISKYGIEGYGLYNLIVESIAEKITTESPIPDLQATCSDIAEFYNGNSDKIEEMTKFMIAQGLFEVDEISNRILCRNIYKFLEANQTRSEQIRKMIKNYKNVSNLPSQTVSDICEEQNRTEQNRTEQIKRYYKEKLFSKGLKKHFDKSTNDKIAELLTTYNLENFKKNIDNFFKYDYWFNKGQHYSPKSFFMNFDECSVEPTKQGNTEKQIEYPKW